MYVHTRQAAALHAGERKKEQKLLSTPQTDLCRLCGVTACMCQLRTLIQLNLRTTSSMGVG